MVSIRWAAVYAVGFCSKTDTVAQFLKGAKRGEGMVRSHVVTMLSAFYTWRTFTTTKRCAGETTQASYCMSSALNFSSGFYCPLGGDRPAPKRVDASDPAETNQRTRPARTT